MESSTFTNSIGMKFVLIPAGTFLMGSPDSDVEAYDFEKPVCRVTISQPFYLGKYPVTQAQGKAVMSNNPDPCQEHPQQPVTHISWNAALAFLRTLSEREGDGDYHLPTEAQWEDACRAGTGSPRYHHDVDAIAWYDMNSDRKPQPVGQKLPNAWGLHDMLGNVWEWCQDGLWTYTADAAVDPIELTGRGDVRIIRGGSWFHDAKSVRAANRSWSEPEIPNDNTLGFRCVYSERRR